MKVRLASFFHKARVFIQNARKDEGQVVYTKHPRKFMTCELTKEEAIDVLLQLDSAKSFPCTIYMPRITEMEEVDNMSLLTTGIPPEEFLQHYSEGNEDTSNALFVVNPITNGYEFNGKKAVEKFMSMIDNAVKEALDERLK